MDAQARWGVRILRVVDHVQAHLDDDLEPHALAALAGFSPHHFHRVFRGMTGESVMGFVRRLRLERAAQRLGREGASVTTLAFDASYESHEAFTRAFRARFGVPPSAYRDRARTDRERAGAVLAAGLRDEPERHVVSLRHRGAYDRCMEAWAALMAWAARAGVLGHEEASLGLVYDDPEITDESHLRYDACLALPAPVIDRCALPPPLTRRLVPGGRYAVASHRGPYETLTESYLALLGRWLPARGVELSNEPIVERYLDDPFRTAPADLRTEICVRLA